MNVQHSNKKQCLETISSELRHAQCDQDSFENARTLAKNGPLQFGKMNKLHWVALCFTVIMAIPCAWAIYEIVAIALDNLTSSDNNLLAPIGDILLYSKYLLGIIILPLSLYFWWRFSFIMLIPNEYRAYENAVQAGDFSHENVASLITQFQNGDGDAGLALFKLRENSFIFKQPIDDKVSSAMAMIVSELGDANAAYTMAQFAEEHLSEDEYYVSLKIAENKGSLKAARDLQELVSTPQSSSGSGWLLAGIILGISVS